MKNIKFIVSILLMAMALHAVAETRPQVLMECNIPAGPFQQVQVLQSGADFYLSRLDNQGDRYNSALNFQEWKTKSLNLKCTTNLRNCGRVYMNRGVWVYQVGDLGMSLSGLCN